MKIIDLTGYLEPGMWHLGSPLAPVEFEKVGSLEKEGWVSHNLKLSIISGTYLETGAHMIEGYRTIDQVRVEELFKETVVIKTKPKKPLEPIEVEELNKTEIKPGQAVLVNAGWSDYWSRKEFVSHSPYFTEAAIDYLLEKKISLLGSDLTSFDHPQAPYMKLLKKLFEKNVLILSPLVNLNQITEPIVELIVFPLKLKGLSASPCRAVVREK
jgi:kynurenine formamidase